MDPITILAGLGLNMAAGAIIEIIKSFAENEINEDEFKSELENIVRLHSAEVNAETVINALAENEINEDEFKSELENIVRLHSAEVNAETVINALAEEGILEIKDSHLHAKEGIDFGSIVGYATMSGKSSLTTDRTSVNTSGTGQLHTQGNARVIQEGGSVSLVAGPGGSASFGVTKGGSASMSAFTKRKK